jgi:hypothetical protein
MRMTLREANARSEVAEAPPGPDDVPGPRRDLAALVVLAAFTVFLWLLRRNGPAQLMEEGFMLALPQRVLHGAVQGRDFDYFYGPLSLWIPAAAYKVFGASLLVERAVGSVYLGLLGGSLYLVGRRWSWWTGLGMGAIAISIGALTISALPVTGAIGFLVLALACALGPRPTTRAAWGVGLACAAASGLRPEFALWAVVLLGVLSLLGRVRLVAWAAFAVGHVPYLFLVARAGWHEPFRVIVQDGTRVSAERWLPWHLRFDGTNVVVFLGFVAIAAAIVVGLVDRRAPNGRGVGLVGLGVIALCIVPEFVQRADHVHTLYVLFVPLAIVPALVAQVQGRLGLPERRRVLAEVVPLAVAALLVCAIQPRLVLRPTLRDLRHLSAGGVAYPATNDGHHWYFLTPGAARAHQELVDEADRVRRPGDTLFVGTLDLARTSYVDTSFYALLPRFGQRAHFYDFHPRVALDYGDRLAADVRAADVLVLCDVGFDEANLSRHRGSEAANRVVRTEFHEVMSAGGCHLYRRR